MITASRLGQLPSPVALRLRWQALAALNVLLTEADDFRDVCFTQRWIKGAALGVIDNQQDANLRGVFTARGAILRGYDESSPLAWSGASAELELVDRETLDRKLGAPREFHRFFEFPEFRFLGSTYCIWRVAGDTAWSTIPMLLGSVALQRLPLAFLDRLTGTAEFVASWVREYFDRDVAPDAVSRLFDGQAIDAATLRRFGRSEDRSVVRTMIAQIGYPCDL